MAGFVGKFSEDCEISYRYAYSINGKRQTFLHHDVENFSHNAAKIFMSLPKELREDIVLSDKLMKKAFVACNLQYFSDVQV